MTLEPLCKDEIAKIREAFAPLTRKWVSDNAQLLRRCEAIRVTIPKTITNINNGVEAPGIAKMDMVPKSEATMKECR